MSELQIPFGSPRIETTITVSTSWLFQTVSDILEAAGYESGKGIDRATPDAAMVRAMDALHSRLQTGMNGCLKVDDGVSI